MILGSMRTPCWLFARTRVDDAVYPIRREWSEDEYPLGIIFQQHVPVNPRSPTRSRKVASKSGRRLDCRVHELVPAVLRGLQTQRAVWLTPAAAPHAARASISRRRLPRGGRQDRHECPARVFDARGGAGGLPPRSHKDPDETVRSGELCDGALRRLRRRRHGRWLTSRQDLRWRGGLEARPRHELCALRCRWQLCLRGSRVIKPTGVSWSRVGAG